MNDKVVNEICFSQPHWRLIAQGFNTEEWFNAGRGERNGGVIAPGRQHLPVGNYYYRFVSHLWPTERQIGGGWWIDFETYKTIKDTAENSQLDFVYAARLFLALPDDWNRLDRIVRAMLIKPVDGYVGQGNVATTEQDKWTPVQHRKVKQIYIPGLAVKSSPKKLYQEVWGDVSFMYAHNQKIV